ncbi:glycosyltransferase [uncultured Clostridium sp.]|uniref:glycosyltransferase n=1 Tax=uncultured Clostridium sp. TaxID=59620 RepID=UPI0032179662
MKVLQINSVCGFGSTGRIATDLYKVLEKEGHECVIAYGRGTTPEGIKSIKIGTDLDNYLHVAKTRIFDKHGFGSTKATKEFIKKVEEYNPDTIHLHNIHGYYINIEILFEYLKRSKKHVVWTLHDCWAFTGHCSHFDYVDCDKWRIGCRSCSQKKEYPSSILYDNSQCNYEKKKELFTSLDNVTIITPSKWLANLVKQSFLGKYQVKVINNGIDLEVFKPTENTFRNKFYLEDKFIILGVASVWKERKGLKYLVELAKKLDSSYKVVIVGVTEKQKNELPNNIIGITRTNNIHELAEIYSTADVFINPTLEDNFPTTNLESLACGTPVITFNTGGSGESLNESCGIVVEKGDVKLVTKCIMNFSKEELNSKNCINRASLYDKNDKFHNYIECYFDKY